MILVTQRVTHASVVVDNQTLGEIQQGMMVLFCAEQADQLSPTQDYPLAQKLVKLRIFADEHQKMNLALQDLPEANLLLVPQFTLAADCRKGNRPSFIGAARPQEGLALFDDFHKACERLLGKTVPTGRFGADMAVTLCNDGPCTFILNNH